MKQRHISFSKIPQFRDVVRNVGHQALFVGLDENGEPIYDNSKGKPKIVFNATVKLHGSNASVCWKSDDSDIWFQSRRKILSLTEDNCGFTQFCTYRIETIKSLIEQAKLRVNEKDYILSIFGEICGGNIAKGVAISQLPKMFVIFALKVTPFDEERSAYYIDPTNLRYPENSIYNIYDFPTFDVEVDFNYPEIAQSKFVELVDSVEKECPVGKALGVTEGCTIGEGLVWTAEWNGTRHVFKTKGSAHSNTKVKKLASVDVEKVSSIKEFVEYAVTENRMEQAVSEVFGDEEPTIQKMGDFLRWLIKDIVDEESDTLEENGLSVKDIGRYISNAARPWFQNLLNKNVGL